MSEQKYDFVVFGASGFTGQFVVEEIARIADEEAGLTWAVAGRSMERLQKILEKASKATGKDLESVPIIVADTGCDESILEMTKQAKIVLNCVGPYRFHGERVVKACIEGGASHLDISGEPQYLERMQLMYNNKAKEAGVYIIGTCGFDSIPAEMGVVFAQKKFQGEINSIEAYLDFEAKEGLVGNVTTLESAVYGFAHAYELKSLRRSLYPEPLPKPSFKLQKRGAVHKNEVVNKYCVPFMGSDKSVVNRTQRYNYEHNKQRPIQFDPYIACSGILQLIGMMVFGIIFAVLSKFSFGQSLLIKYPEIFTFGAFKKSGPTKKQIENTSFSMTLVSKGWSTKLEDPAEQHTDKPEVVSITKVFGPEPGYVTTPICMVQCGLVLLKEKSKIPKGGGVLTPGSAFAETSLIDRLQNHNIKFQEVKE
ncbi:saccharopine dehydrogenase-like oxidoreductase isoform X2 [Mytilus trossulus]|uniref:saccharopine dehydrogenase-like oxidoreductase isoform X2 n=1 Tax=Mytilus trossulus TaxID=6551 RepID=UPI0030055296